MGAFFNLRAASMWDADGFTVLHEVNMAKVITAKEMAFTKDRVFIMGLFPVELLIELILLAARTQRCAGEGELMFGFTNHGPMLPERSPGCQYAVFGGFGRLRLGLPEIHPVRLIGFPKGFQRDMFDFGAAITATDWFVWDRTRCQKIPPSSRHRARRIA
jgi:hypothetical protein